MRFQKKETADFKKFSEINVIKTLIAFWNTDGGIIQIRDDERALDENFFYSVLRGVRGKLPFGVLTGDYSKDKNVLSNSLYLRSTIIDGTPFFVIDVYKVYSKKDLFYLLNDDGGKDYYFRVKGKNVKTDEKNASYWEKIALYDAPKYNDYQPADDVLNSKLNGLRGEIVIRSIGDITRKRFVYKYMDLESALLSLENGTLRFVEPTNWDDQYEGRFYNAVYYDSNNNILNSNLTPFLYATCLSTKQENEAAWVLYAHNRKGLAARCVEFKLNIKSLLDQITKHVIDSYYSENRMSLYFGNVTYLTKFDIDNLHKKYVPCKPTNDNYHKYFDNFSLKCYLNLLLLKRVTFEHEKEFRIFIIPEDKLPKTRKIGSEDYIRDGKTGKDVYPQSTFVHIDWTEIISEVRYDKNSTSYEYALLENAIKKINPSIPIKEYDPYEDESMSKSPLNISTN